jgi:hypothetical protein
MIRSSQQKERAMITLPIDDNGNPIHIMGYAPHGTQTLAIRCGGCHATSAAIAHDIEWVTLISTGKVRFEVGGQDVLADMSSPVLFSGIYIDVPLKRADRFFSFLATDGACIVYVMGRK